MTTVRKNTSPWNPRALHLFPVILLLPGIAAAFMPHWSETWALIAASLVVVLAVSAIIGSVTPIGATRESAIWIFYLAMDAFGFLGEVPLWRTVGPNWWQPLIYHCLNFSRDSPSSTHLSVF